MGKIVRINIDDLPDSPIAGEFGDNGGDPDGHGPLMAPAEWFTSEELALLLESGGGDCGRLRRPGFPRIC